MLVLKTELAMPNSIRGLRVMASLGRFWDLNRASRTTETGRKAVRRSMCSHCHPKAVVRLADASF